MNTNPRPHIYYAADLGDPWEERYSYTRDPVEIERLLEETGHPARLTGVFRRVYFVRDADGNLVEAYAAKVADVRGGTPLETLL